MTAGKAVVRTSERLLSSTSASSIVQACHVTRQPSKAKSNENLMTIELESILCSSFIFPHLFLMFLAPWKSFFRPSLHTVQRPRSNALQSKQDLVSFQIPLAQAWNLRSFPGYPRIACVKGDFSRTQPIHVDRIWLYPTTWLRRMRRGHSQLVSSTHFPQTLVGMVDLVSLEKLIRTFRVVVIIVNFSGTYPLSDRPLVPPYGHVEAFDGLSSGLRQEWGTARSGSLMVRATLVPHTDQMTDSLQLGVDEVERHIAD